MCVKEKSPLSPLHCLFAAPLLNSLPFLWSLARVVCGACPFCLLFAAPRSAPRLPVANLSTHSNRDSAAECMSVCLCLSLPHPLKKSLYKSSSHLPMSNGSHCSVQSTSLLKHACRFLVPVNFFLLFSFGFSVSLPVCVHVTYPSPSVHLHVTLCSFSLFLHLCSLFLSILPHHLH